MLTSNSDHRIRHLQKKFRATNQCGLSYDVGQAGADPGFVHRGGGYFERSERRAKRETSEARDERSE